MNDFYRGYMQGFKDACLQEQEQRNVSEQMGEPVAIHQFRHFYCADWYDGVPDQHDGFGPYEVRTLYTTPQQRTWVGLTDEEVDELDCVKVMWQDYESCEIHGIKEFYRNIEAKLKAKNERLEKNT
jgi:hypothetical protein